MPPILENFNSDSKIDDNHSNRINEKSNENENHKNHDDDDDHAKDLCHEYSDISSQKENIKKCEKYQKKCDKNDDDDHDMHHFDCDIINQEENSMVFKRDEELDNIIDCVKDIIEKTKKAIVEKKHLNFDETFENHDKNYVASIENNNNSQLKENHDSNFKDFGRKTFKNDYLEKSINNDNINENILKYGDDNNNYNKDAIHIINAKKSNQIIIKAKKNFLKIFDYLDSSELRISFVKWLDIRIEEAKSLGKIFATLDDESHIDANNSRNLELDDNNKCPSIEYYSKSDYRIKAEKNQGINIDCHGLFRYSPKIRKILDNNDLIIPNYDKETISNIHIKNGDNNKNANNIEYENNDTDSIEEKLCLVERKQSDNNSDDDNNDDDATMTNLSQKLSIENSKGFLRTKKIVNTECHICGKKFANQSTLKRHNQLHNGIRFKCVHCNKTFSRQDYLKIHNKKCPIINNNNNNNYNNNNNRNENNSLNNKNLISGIENDTINKMVNIEKNNEYFDNNNKEEDLNSGIDHYRNVVDAKNIEENNEDYDNNNNSNKSNDGFRIIIEKKENRDDSNDKNTSSDLIDDEKKIFTTEELKNENENVAKSIISDELKKIKSIDIDTDNNIV